jgi:hypothetical protein
MLRKALNQPWSLEAEKRRNPKIYVLGMASDRSLLR